MRLGPLIAPSVAASALAILTGCHLSRIPSPALSTASVSGGGGGTICGSVAHGLGREIRQINFSLRSELDDIYFGAAAIQCTFRQPHHLSILKIL
jgi:hypothetical protein